MHVLRGWRRDWMLGGFVILTLSLGIGANAAVFAVIDRLLLRGPEGVRDAERVARMYRSEGRENGLMFESSPFDYPAYAALRGGVQRFAGIAAYSFGNGTLGHGAAARHVAIEYASGSLFSTLGATLARGRSLEGNDDVATDGPPPAVISYALWELAFGGADSVLGRRIEIDDATCIVVGVARPGFTGPELAPVDVWLPLRVRGDALDLSYRTDWDGPWLFIVTRLADGVGVVPATREATAVFQHAYAGVDRTTATSSIRLAPLTRDAHAHWTREASTSFVIFGLSILVLMIALANTMQLLVARLTRRRGEIAVRMALGASRGRIVGVLITDCIVLAAGSAIGSMAVAAGLSRIIWIRLLPEIAWPTHAMAIRVCIAGATSALAVGATIGLLLWRAAREIDIALVLRMSGAARPKNPVRQSVLAVMQSSLVVVLLALAGLFVRSLIAASGINYGVDSWRTHLATVEWGNSRSTETTPTTAEWNRRLILLREGVERLRAAAPVAAASLVVDMPFHGGPQARAWPSDAAVRPSAPRRFFVYAVDAGYFTTVGTRISAGRAFGNADEIGREREVVVSREVVRLLWPSQNPVGECLVIGTDSIPCARVVGVAEDVRDFRGEAPAVMYVPIEQATRRRDATVIAIPRQNARDFPGLTRSVLLTLSPDIRYVGVSSLHDAVAPQLRLWELGSLLFGLMGLLALIVASVGMFGLVMSEATARTREMAIRKALGANLYHVLALLLRRSLATTLAAVVVGTGLVIAASGTITPLLFKGSALDSTVLSAVAVVLLSVTVLASLGPALQVNRHSPADSLRLE